MLLRLLFEVREVELRENYGNEDYGAAEIFTVGHLLIKDYCRADNAEDRFERHNDRSDGGVDVVLCDYLQGVRDAA